MRTVRPLLAACALASLAACNAAPHGAGNGAGGNAAAVEAKAATLSPDAPAVVNRVAATRAGEAATQKFINAAAAANVFEVQAAQIAERQAKSHRVIGFAAMVIRDHGQLAAALNAVAEHIGITVDATLGPDQIAQLGELRDASGGAFDQLYRQQQLRVHQKMLSNLRDYADNGRNRHVKAWATSAVPVINRHMAQLRKLAP